MPIYQLDPNRANRQQMQFFLQQMALFAMQRAQQKASMDELKARTEAAEKMAGIQLQAEGLARPTRGAKDTEVTPSHVAAGAPSTTTSGKLQMRQRAEKPDVTLAGQQLKITPKKYGRAYVMGNYMIQPGPQGQMNVAKIADTSKKQAVKGKDFWYTFDPTDASFSKTDVRVDKSGNKYQRKTRYTYDEKNDVVYAQDYNFDPNTGAENPVGEKYRAPKNLAFDLLKFMMTGQGGGLPTGTQSGWDGPGMYQMADGNQKMISTKEEYDSIFGEQ